MTGEEIESILKSAYGKTMTFQPSGEQENEHIDKKTIGELQSAVNYNEPFALYLLSKLKASEAQNSESDCSEAGLAVTKNMWAEVCNLNVILCLYYEEKRSGTEKVNYRDVISNLMESCYKLALYKYFTGEKKEDILSNLADIEDPRSCVLRGALIYDTAESYQQYSQAVEHLMYIFDSEYIAAKKTETEYRLMACAALKLSYCCRLGYGIHADITAAYDVLAYGRKFIKTEKAMAVIEDEIKLYEFQDSGSCNYAG